MRAWLLALAAAAALVHAAEPAEVKAARHSDAVARCEAQRGVDCHTAQGLHEWLLQERSRKEAEAEGSRSVHQRAHSTDPRDSAN
ncbi:MAG: hypothetical protein ACREVQ_07815 [Burkholderiales bacterium]